MCPFCLATAAIVAGSATGTGGLTALVARAFRRTRIRRKLIATPKQKEDYHGYQRAGTKSAEDRLPR